MPVISLAKLGISAVGCGVLGTSATLGGATYYLIFGPSYSKERSLEADLKKSKEEQVKKKAELDKKVEEARKKGTDSFGSYWQVVQENLKSKKRQNCLSEEMKSFNDSKSWFFRRYAPKFDRCNIK